MPDQPTGPRNPARLPTGRVPAIPGPRDRATRVHEVHAVLEQAAAGSAHARPDRADPARRHEIIPQQAPGGYVCGVCLLPIAPADCWPDERHTWRHAPGWDLA